jgi:hypothetical protein
VPGCKREVVEDCAEAFLPRIVVVVVAAGAMCGFDSGSSMRGDARGGDVLDGSSVSEIFRLARSTVSRNETAAS